MNKNNGLGYERPAYEPVDDEFKNAIRLAVEAKVKSAVEINRVQKNNGVILTALTIRDENCVTAPHILPGIH